MTKITYLGGGGKVGRIAVQMICSLTPADRFLEIVLVGSGTTGSLTRLEGFTEDLSGALALWRKIGNIKFTITNDYLPTKNSDLVLCSACLWPTPLDREKYAVYDPSGRLVQSMCNAKPVGDIISQLWRYCQDTAVVLATNQVDIMCYLAREIAPNMPIFGLTGGVDSTRLRQVIFRRLGKETEGLMIGYHNNFMIPLLESFESNNLAVSSGHLEYSEDELDYIVHEVRVMGKNISDKQNRDLNSVENTGASVLPAAALADMARTYCFGGKSLVESYNVRIREKSVADQYGVPVGTDMSIPVEISENSITPKMNVILSEEEKVNIREARIGFTKDLEIVHAHSVLGV